MNKNVFSLSHYNSRGLRRAKNENLERLSKGEKRIFISLQMKGWAPSPFRSPRGPVS